MAGFNVRRFTKLMDVLSIQEILTPVSSAVLSGCFSVISISSTLTRLLVILNLDYRCFNCVVWGAGKYGWFQCTKVHKINGCPEYSILSIPQCKRVHKINGCPEYF